MIPAILDGGPLDGRELQVPEESLELQLDDDTSGRVVTVRYVLHYTDKKGVRHYYVPTR